MSLFELWFSQGICPVVGLLGYMVVLVLVFFFFKVIQFLFIYLFIYGYVGSSFPRKGLLQLRQAGATPHCGARASHYCGLSYCRAQAPDAQAQQLWLMGPVAPRHVGSSQTRARTPVPCIGRQTLNHCATREAPTHRLLKRNGLRDFPGGPVVKNLPCNAGDTGSIPGQGTVIPHATGQLSPRATTTELSRLN